MKTPVKGSPEQKHSTGANVNPNVNQLDAEASARFNDKFGLPIGGGKFSDVHLSYISIADEIRSHIAKEKELSRQDERAKVLVEVNKWITHTHGAMGYKKTGDRYTGLNNGLYWLRAVINRYLTPKESKE